MQVVEKLLSDLKARGARITRSRKAILEILRSSKGPVAVSHLLESLQNKSLARNKTTVYREIDFLLAEKIIREVDLLDGKKRYELLDSNSHHHHLVCKECGDILCVEMEDDLGALEKRLLKRYRFKVTNHALEFFGICKDCQ